MSAEPRLSTYLHSRAIEKEIPISGTFELTSRCNFRCGMMPKIQINVFENGFENAWKQIIAQVREIRFPKKCTSCKYSNICHACAAMFYTETGGFDQVPEYVCQMSKSIYELTKKEQEKYSADK